MVLDKIFSKLRMLFYQSCVNRTKTVHGTFRGFLFLLLLLFFFKSHLLYGICVKIFIMNRYILKSYKTTKNAIDRAGTAVVSTIPSNEFFMILGILGNSPEQ